MGKEPMILVSFEISGAENHQAPHSFFGENQKPKTTSLPHKFQNP
jgi:hypothetical protein